MAHEAYTREVPGADGAVLLIHGILGTPDHFRDLVPLVPDDWSVYNLLLDGHGGEVKDFSHTSMKKWRSQVHTKLTDLRQRHEKIILVGHSMGTLFAIDEAIRDPGKLEALFLLQVPLRPWVRPKAALGACLLPFGVVTGANRDMQADCSLNLNPRLWEYLGWVPRFLELLERCVDVRNRLDQLEVPCQVFVSKQDELVSTRTCRDFRKHPHIRWYVLRNSGHFVYRGTDREFLQSKFAALF